MSVAVIKLEDQRGVAVFRLEHGRARIEWVAKYSNYCAVLYCTVLYCTVKKEDTVLYGGCDGTEPIVNRVAVRTCTGCYCMGISGCQTPLPASHSVSTESSDVLLYCPFVMS